LQGRTGQQQQRSKHAGRCRPNCGRSKQLGISGTEIRVPSAVLDWLWERRCASAALLAGEGNKQTKIQCACWCSRSSLPAVYATSGVSEADSGHAYVMSNFCCNISSQVICI
jgi:hypothetical protein